MSERKPKPVVTWYPRKVQRSTTVTFTPEVHEALARWCETLDASRSDVVEHALRKLMHLPVNPALDARAY